MAITVRTAASEQDWEQGLAVLFAVYVNEWHNPPDRAQRTYRREVLEPEGAFLVAVDGHGRVCGATLFLHAGSTFHQVALPGEREFRFLAVRSDARGNGVGDALVLTVIARSEAEGCSALVLWTRPEMRAAQRLYHRLGFERAPDRDVDDPRGFTRLCFKKNLGME